MSELTQEKVDVSLPLLSVAGRLALMNGDHDAYSIVFDTIKKYALKKSQEIALISDFLRKCECPDENDVIPFTLDAFTAASVACMFPKDHRCKFIVYSDYSDIEAGYLVCKNNEIRYVDRAVTDRNDLDLPVFPKFAIEPHLYDQIASVELLSPKVAFHENSGDSLCIQFSGDSAELFAANQQSASLTILTNGEHGKVVRRSLSKVKLSTNQSGYLSVALNGEQQLEVHASFFNGSWLRIDGDVQSILFKIPSLDPQAAPESVRISSVGLNFLGSEKLDTAIQVSLAIAQQFVSRYWWFSSVNLDQWFQIATAVNGQGKKSKL